MICHHSSWFKSDCPKVTTRSSQASPSEKPSRCNICSPSDHGSHDCQLQDVTLTDKDFLKNSNSESKKK